MTAPHFMIYAKEEFLVNFYSFIYSLLSVTKCRSTTVGGHGIGTTVYRKPTMIYSSLPADLLEASMMLSSIGIVHISIIPFYP